jgi:type III secretory pathway component EscV
MNNEHLKLVYRPAADIAACLLLNGRISGTWIHKKSSEKLAIMVTPFSKLDKSILKQIEHAVKDMGSFFGVQETRTMLDP